MQMAVKVFLTVGQESSPVLLGMGLGAGHGDGNKFCLPSPSSK